MQRHNFLDPHLLGPWGGAKRSKIIKSQSQSQFQRFLSQTLCVFSKLKDIKHIRGDFYSVAWVMPQGWDLVVPWGLVGPKTFFPKFNKIWCMSYLHEWHMQRHKFLGPRLLGPMGGAKGQISLNLNYKVNFKDFYLNFVCLLTNERNKHIRRDFHSVPWVMHAPGFGTWGCWGSKI